LKENGALDGCFLVVATQIYILPGNKECWKNIEGEKCRLYSVLLFE
jgi:hypothetical protein